MQELPANIKREQNACGIFLSEWFHCAKDAVHSTVAVSLNTAADVFIKHQREADACRDASENEPILPVPTHRSGKCFFDVRPNELPVVLGKKALRLRLASRSNFVRIRIGRNQARMRRIQLPERTSKATGWRISEQAPFGISRL